MFSQGRNIVTYGPLSDKPHSKVITFVTSTIKLYQYAIFHSHLQSEMPIYYEAVSNKYISQRIEDKLPGKHFAYSFHWAPLSLRIMQRMDQKYSFA